MLSDESPMEDGDNDVYIKFAEIAKERNEEEWHQTLQSAREIIAMVERYIDNGIDQEKAIKKALRKYRYEFEEYLDSTGDIDDE
ncbi:hypothetical protein KP79_PYT01633 [Mizuhopecten yessoensis]|uniref:Uncharacterized protein n=1 Tax=Mizuhopecten yessoensis TaxID=6573 RepID=A0A210Q8C0_MIZYE|nr:hypothetical protein KP79_PYT01633 [Mizuhopecten yessoensis]